MPSIIETPSSSDKGLFSREIKKACIASAQPFWITLSPSLIKGLLWVIITITIIQPTCTRTGTATQHTTIQSLAASQACSLGHWA